jgi:hypothetical protein
MFGHNKAKGRNTAPFGMIDYMLQVERKKKGVWHTRGVWQAEKTWKKDFSLLNLSAVSTAQLH